MTSVKIVSGGAGYTVAPNVRFSAGARVKGGNEAVAVAVVKDGAVVSVQLSTTQGYWLPIGAGNAFSLRPVSSQNDRFSKTGSGQTSGNAEKPRTFRRRPVVEQRCRNWSSHGHF